MSLATSLISFWKLDEASGNALDSWGTNELTETSGTIAAATGKIDGGRAFEAGDTEYFTIVDNADLSTGDIDFTFAAWIYLESISSFPLIAGKWSATTGDQEWIMYIDTGSSNRLVFGVLEASATVMATTFGSLSTGVWYHVVCWHDSVNNQIGVSVNGSANTASHSSGTHSGAGNFYLGGYPVTSNYHDGLIDEAVFWKRVLTSNERLQIYNGGTGIPFARYFDSANAGGLYDSLISYWKCDEATGGMLDCHKTNHLLETSGTIGSTTGIIGNARDFEAGDSEYFELTDNADLSTGNIDFTFSCWVNPESLAINNATIAMKGTSTGNQREWRLSYSTSLTKYYGVISETGSDDTTHVTSTVTATTTGVWVHLVLRHDSVNNLWDIFVNGTKTSAAHTVGSIDGTGPFRIGQDAIFDTLYWDGLIDECGFWKKALSDSEVSQLYNGGSGLAYENFNAAPSGGNPWYYRLMQRLVNGMAA